MRIALARADRADGGVVPHREGGDARRVGDLADDDAEAIGGLDPGAVTGDGGDLVAAVESLGDEEVPELAACAEENDPGHGA